MMMDVRNIGKASSWFEVLQTGERSQTAVMTLEPGAASGPTPNAHAQSEQVLLVVEGELEAEVAGEKRAMRKGDVVVIPPGVKHRFSNPGSDPAVTFSVYAPPEYPAESKG
jgi:mannose-6-phosphate isomerase-like protein (cupin superfamily)